MKFWKFLSSSENFKNFKITLTMVRKHQAINFRKHQESLKWFRKDWRKSTYRASRGSKNVSGLIYLRGCSTSSGMVRKVSEWFDDFREEFQEPPWSVTRVLRTSTETEFRKLQGRVLRTPQNSTENFRADFQKPPEKVPTRSREFLENVEENSTTSERFRRLQKRFSKPPWKTLSRSSWIFWKHSYLP